MKKKYVSLKLFILIFSIFLFSNNVHAETFTFDVKNDKNYAFIKGFCYNETVTGSLCSSFKCKNGKKLPTPSYGEFFSEYLNDLLEMNNCDEISSFEYDTDFNSLTGRIKSLDCDGVSCYDYFGKNYCNDWKNTSNELCKSLKSEDGKQVTDGDEKYCLANKVTLFVYDSYTDDYKRDKVSNSVMLFEKDNKLVCANEDFVYDRDTDSCVSNNNRIYLYPYGSTANAFLKSYLGKIEESGGSCPTLNFCLYGQSGNEVSWYTEFGECDSSVYKYGISQSVDSNGSTTSVGGLTEDNVFGDYIIFKKNNFSICEDNKIFGDKKLTDFVQGLVNVVKVLIPVILLVLGSIDFVKAIFAQDESGIKKAQSVFIKRLIIAVVIFLIPSIFGIILDIASKNWDFIQNSLCGIKI